MTLFSITYCMEKNVCNKNKQKTTTRRHTRFKMQPNSGTFKSACADQAMASWSLDANTKIYTLKNQPTKSPSLVTAV